MLSKLIIYGIEGIILLYNLNESLELTQNKYMF